MADLIIPISFGSFMGVLYLIYKYKAPFPLSAAFAVIQNRRAIKELGTTLKKNHVLSQGAQPDIAVSVFDAVIVKQNNITGNIAAYGFDIGEIVFSKELRIRSKDSLRGFSDVISKYDRGSMPPYGGQSIDEAGHTSQEIRKIERQYSYCR